MTNSIYAAIGTKEIYVLPPSGKEAKFAVFTRVVIGHHVNEDGVTHGWPIYENTVEDVPALMTNLSFCGKIWHLPPEDLWPHLPPHYRDFVRAWNAGIVENPHVH